MQPGSGLAERQVSLARAWFGAALVEFLSTGCDTIIGRLVTNSDFTVLPSQLYACAEELRLLQAHLVGLQGSIYLEFSIPRMGRRIDAVLLIQSIVFVLEFKVGEIAFDRAAVDQVWDYALDLK